MKQLYQPFDVCVADMEHWNERALIYQFFEIVQIMEGEGVRVTNSHNYTYHKGSIFLFTPTDCRGFESTTPTRFCSIRFSSVFLEQYKSKPERERIMRWLKQLETIFTHHNRFEEILIKRSADCDMIASLIGNMIDEYTNKQSYYTENLQHLVTLVLNILSRNAAPEQPLIADNRCDEPLINKMLAYIHRNIDQPEKLRLKNLAAQFNFSEHYIGEYFKKFTTSSLQDYVTKYKLKIIEQRLLHTDHPINRIAAEFGFSDESHLSRHFRKHTNHTPAQFRKVHKA